MRARARVCVCVCVCVRAHVDLAAHNTNTNINKLLTELLRGTLYYKILMTCGMLSVTEIFSRHNRLILLISCCFFKSTGSV